MFIDRKIYLASSSPRRQELLRQLKIEFDVVVPDFNEDRIKDEPPDEYVKRLALGKAQAALEIIQNQNLPSLAVVAADTCVVLGSEVLGKPENRAEGEDMLRRLSNKTHQVHSAVSLINDNREYINYAVSTVHFSELSDIEIARYWDSDEPCDKAGAYGIQGIAAGFIKGIEGSYTGVVGLPLYELVQLLKKSGLAKV